MTDPTTDHLSRTVAAARLALEEKQTAYAAATERADHLRRRITECENRKAAITAHRLEGDNDPAEAAELYALGHDLDTLRGLLIEAEERAERSRPDTEKAVLSNAEAALAQHQRQAEYQAMENHVRELETTFIEGLRHLWDEAGRRGIRRRTIQELYQFDATLLNVTRLNSFHGLERRQ